MIKERLKVWKSLFLTSGYYLYLWKDKFFIFASIIFILLAVFKFTSSLFSICFLVFTFLVSITNYIILNPDKYKIDLTFGSGKNGNK